MRGGVLGRVAAAQLLLQGGGVFSQPAAELAVSAYPDAKPGMVCLTFDDGTKDHYALAAPLLERYGYRGIFSIVPDLMGHGRYMGWGNARTLLARGHEVANHSMSHANMVRLLEAGDTNELQRQIWDSADLIEERTGVRPWVFCFPYTALNEDLNAIVRESGQEPMLRLRFVFLHDTSPADLDAYLDTVVENRLYKGLLFHGVDPHGEAWETFRDPGAFEAMLKVLKVREADLHVGGYTENAHYLALRDAVSLAKVEDSATYSIYRLAFRSDAVPPPGGGWLTLELAHPDRISGVRVRGQPVLLKQSVRGTVHFKATVGSTITLIRRQAQ